MTVQGPCEGLTAGSAHDFRDALMSVPVMIVVNRGTDQRFAWLNASARRAFGDRELIGKTLLEAFPDVGPLGRKVVAMVAGGQPYMGVDEPITIDWSGAGKPETRYLCGEQRSGPGSDVHDRAAEISGLTGLRTTRRTVRVTPVASAPRASRSRRRPPTGTPPCTCCTTSTRPSGARPASRDRARARTFATRSRARTS